MRKLRLIAIFLVANLIVVFVAIWLYDAYKSRAIEQGTRQASAFAESEKSLRALQAERINYGLNLANGLRTSVAEVHASMGRLPDSNEAAGARPAQSYRSELLNSIEVGAGGVIVVNLAPWPGLAQPWLRFTPREVGEGMPLAWTCESNVADIRQFAATCAPYVPKSGAPN